MRANAMQSTIVRVADGVRDPRTSIGHIYVWRVLAWDFTLREVEERTAALAEESNTPAYRVSGSWLDRAEREDRSISATKLIGLAAVYDLTPAEMLTFCPDLSPAPDRVFVMPSPGSNHHQLAEPAPFELKRWLSGLILNTVPPDRTMLLVPDAGIVPVHLRSAVIGLSDASLESMIPTGSIVFADTQKKSIADRRKWHNEFGRPVYLLLTRDGYHCGFCSLDAKAEWLNVVPPILSRDSQDRRRKFKRDVEVVGTVVATFIRRPS